MLRTILYLSLGAAGGYCGMLIPMQREESLSCLLYGFILACGLTILVVDHYYKQWREKRKNSIRISAGR